MMTTYINGFSAICAQGQNNEEIKASLFNCPKLPVRKVLELDGESQQVHYFSAFNQTRLSLAELVFEIEKQIVQTIDMAGWDISELGQIPLFLASTSFSMAEYEIKFFGLDAEQLAKTCAQQPFSLNDISIQLKQKWPNLEIINVATSCTSSANALLYAQRYIQLGLIQRAIIVGFESFNSVTVDGFHSLGLLTSEFVPPFSKSSKGLILGEGIGCIAVSNQANSSQSYSVTLAGGEMQCDTTNITTTHPDNVAALIQSVLAQSSMSKTELRAIKVHATGSPTNDQVEQQSMDLCLNPHIPRLFFKPYIGHTLGACGVLECILLLLCLETLELPAQPTYTTPEEHTNLNNHFLKSPLSFNGYYLMNYLGFGGNNTFLLLGVNQ